MLMMMIISVIRFTESNQVIKFNVLVNWNPQPPGILTFEWC